MMTPRHKVNRCKAAAAALAIGLGNCAGCYDGDALVVQARSAVLNSRLAEVDLGFYYTTLPREPDATSLTEIRLHIFGTVPRYRVSEIKRQLNTEDYRLRHETLAAIRRSTRQELAEANFNTLRARIEEAVNRNLAGSPIKSIGFYEIAVRQR